MNAEDSVRVFVREHLAQPVRLVYGLRAAVGHQREFANFERHFLKTGGSAMRAEGFGGYGERCAGGSRAPVTGRRASYGASTALSLGAVVANSAVVSVRSLPSLTGSGRVGYTSKRHVIPKNTAETLTFTVTSAHG